MPAYSTFLRAFEVTNEPYANGRSCEQTIFTKMLNEYQQGLYFFRTITCFDQAYLPAGSYPRYCIVIPVLSSAFGATFPSYCDAQSEQTCSGVISFSCAQADEGNVMGLSCPAGSLIYPVNAFYGGMTGSCGIWQENNAGCSSDWHGAGSGPVVAACYGQATCSITVSNGFWGSDPCNGLHKVMSVDYLCLPPSFLGS
jgi:hypothetical protein